MLTGGLKVYEVGGAVRDRLLGIPSKDVDFAVETESFDAMRAWMVRHGFEIFLETEQFLTIRARVPQGHALRARTDVADFVMCRKDSPGSDGRRPDWVRPGTILDDLARRDFTVNAMAIDCTFGDWIDPHDGRRDIMDRTLRFVGNPYMRIREDGLRVLRAFRFQVTRGFWIEPYSLSALRDDPASAVALSKVSVERIKDELHRMFKADTQATVMLIAALPDALREAMLPAPLWLEPTLKARSRT